MSGSESERVFFADASYDGQFERSLYAIYGGGADLGEAFATARRIGRRGNSRERWHDEWMRTAVAASERAGEARGAGDIVTARAAFLRASEYYRQAFYYLRADRTDERLQRAFDRHVEAFDAAVELMTVRARKVRIPYDGTSVVGYLFAPNGSDEPYPTILMPCGYDSTAQTGWYQVPDAIERGYAVLLFEGPGQGEALYKQGLPLRPDFEHVLGQIIDWAIEQPGIDAARLTLMGRSFAGYLAPRAATREHRIAALICDPAQPDMSTKLPSGIGAKIALAVLPVLMRLSANRNEFFRARMTSHGCTELSEWFAEYQRFTMLTDAGSISCPTLVVECEGDFAGGGGPALFAALTCQKLLVNLTAAEGAGGHCGGLGQQVWGGVVYGWLDEVMAGIAAPVGAGRNTPARNEI